MLPHLRFLFSFAGKSYSLKIFSQSQKGAQLCIFFVYRFHSGSKFFHEQLLIQLHAPIFEAVFRFWMRYIYFYICNCYKNYIYTIYISFHFWMYAIFIISESVIESTSIPIRIKRISISFAERPELPQPHTNTRSALFRSPTILPI